MARQPFFIDFIAPIDTRHIQVEGYVSVGDAGSLFVRTGDGAVHQMGITPNARTVQIDGDDNQVKEYECILEIALLHGSLEIIDARNRALPLRTNRYSGFSGLRYSYSSQHKDFYLQNRRKKIMVYRRTAIRLVMLEVVFLLRILSDWRVGAALQTVQKSKRNIVYDLVKAVGIIGESVITIPRDIFIRYSAFLQRQQQKHQIWIYSDRPMAAGDNGEALFQYAVHHSSPSTKHFFVLSPSSPDKKRFDEYTVLSPKSLQYRITFLQAHKIISSHADDDVINPFRRQINRFVDQFRFDFVFLQHGIIRNDLSRWLNRYEKNIRLFVTSAKKEYDSIINYDYSYTEREITLTGLPRYDFLSNHAKRKVIIMPTYRLPLVRTKVALDGTRPYDPLFKTSEYYKFYQAVIDDKRLREALRRSGAEGELYIHPNFYAQSCDFRVNKEFTVARFPYDYTKAFNDGSLLVSDYSSVVLDFAYLKKPVIYTHFDVDSFYANHSYEQGSFFSDAKDGFGPVTTTKEELVDAIIACIEQDFAMDQHYQERVDRFFAWHDRNNCCRVFDAVRGLDG